MRFYRNYSGIQDDDKARCLGVSSKIMDVELSLAIVEVL